MVDRFNDRERNRSRENEGRFDRGWDRDFENEGRYGRAWDRDFESEYEARYGASPTGRGYGGPGETGWGEGRFGREGRQERFGGEGWRTGQGERYGARRAYGQRYESDWQPGTRTGRMAGQWEPTDYGADYGTEYGYGDFGYGRDYDLDRGYGMGGEPTTWSYTAMWWVPGPLTGEGPQDWQRSADRIREDVCERLTQHGQLNARNIQLEVDQGTGEVTLNGTVNSRNEKRMAEDTAMSVIGVRDVHNRLRVEQQQEGQQQQQQGQQTRQKQKQKS